MGSDEGDTPQGEERESRRVRFAEDVIVSDGHTPEVAPLKGGGSRPGRRHDHRRERHRRKKRRGSGPVGVWRVLFVAGACAGFGVVAYLAHQKYWPSSGEAAVGGESRSRRRQRGKVAIDEADAHRAREQLIAQTRANRLRELEGRGAQVQARIVANEARLEKNKEEYNGMFGGSVPSAGPDEDGSPLETDSGFDQGFVLKPQQDLEKRRVAELQKLIGEETAELRAELGRVVGEIRHVFPGHPMFAQGGRPGGGQRPPPPPDVEGVVNSPLGATRPEMNASFAGPQ